MTKLLEQFSEDASEHASDIIEGVLKSTSIEAVQHIVEFFKESMDEEYVFHIKPYSTRSDKNFHFFRYLIRVMEFCVDNNSPETAIKFGLTSTFASQSEVVELTIRASESLDADGVRYYRQVWDHTPAVHL